MSGISADSPATQRPAPPRSRRLPIGAECAGNGQAHMRIWAPRADGVAVIVEGAEPQSLDAEDHGYFSGLISARPGDLYRIRLSGDQRLYPDPASRFQPSGPHGPSEIIDPAAFRWTDAGWHPPA